MIMDRVLLLEMKHAEIKSAFSDRLLKLGGASVVAASEAPKNAKKKRARRTLRQRGRSTRLYAATVTGSARR